MKILALLSSLVLVITATVAAAAMPRCVVRSGETGGPAILVDGQVYAPIFFAANNQFGRDDVLLDELRLAAEADIPFFSFNLLPPWQTPEDQIHRIIEAFCSANPNGYFYPRVWLGAPVEWLRQHPEDCITLSDGERLDMASPSSSAWRQDAGAQLREVVELIQRGPYADRFIGVMVTYLQTGEWFYPRTDEYMDYSAANLAAFRKWLRQRYRRDKALQQAWGDPEITLDVALLPTPEQREAAAWGIFRDPQRNRAVIDMQRFQSEQIADVIDYFGQIVKDTTKDRALVGAFYGYTFELNHNGPRALAHSGHLALGRLLESDAIDLVHAPYAYFERGLGEPGHFHLPVDSIPLHGKLAIIEDDTFTHLAAQPPDPALAPGWEGRTQSLEETLAITRRNYGNFLMHRCGFWFFDLLSDGRWNDRDFWRSAGLARRVAAELRGLPPFQPEVAFVVDEEAVAFLLDSTHPVLLHSLGYQRHELGQLGAPVGYYLSSDLGRLPASVRLLILPNAYHVDHSTRRAVEAVLGRGGAVVWVYAPDIMGSEGPDVSRIGAVTGFQVEVRHDGEPLMISIENNQKQFELREFNYIPRLIISEPMAQSLATYTHTGETAIAARQEGSGTVVYCAVPHVPLAVLQYAARQARVHVYREPPGHVTIVGQYLFAHGSGGENENAVLEWTGGLTSVTRLIPPARLPLPCENGRRWRDLLPAGAIVVYRCE